MAIEANQKKRKKIQYWQIMAIEANQLILAIEVNQKMGEKIRYWQIMAIEVNQVGKKKT